MIVAAWLAACAPEPSAPLVATDLEITQTRPGSPMRAAYLTLRNNSDGALRINRVTSPSFGRVELHESTIENGVSRMRPVSQLEIEPDSEIRLERGGLHLMLMQPTADPADDETVTLNFFDDERLVISVSSRPSGDPGP
jgi:copper(I)-binding protein